jgi:hypothetical protein
LILDVHVLDTDGATVGGLQPPDQIVNGRPVAAAEAAALHDTLHIGFAHTELGRLQQRVARPAGLEWVQMCDEVPQLTVRVHEVEDTEDRGRRVALRRPEPLGRQGSTVTVGRELEAREEDSPALIDRGRIRLVTPILLGDVVLVRKRNAVEVCHAAH